MVDFRRCITALAALALFAGLASAQGTSGSASFTCAANVSSTPQIRGEGYTELVGDITLLCTGGQILTPGTQVPQVNITLFLNAPVTSRLIAIPAGGTASEALLLIDEPGASALGAIPATGVGTAFGPGAAVNPCAAAVSTPCAAFVTQVLTTATGTPPASLINVATATNLGAGTVAQATAAADLAANVFQGVVSGNSVTWFGVPVLPPGTTGITRTFRLSNVRINATALAGGGASPGQTVFASIAVSNPASLPITTTVPNVGFVQSGLGSSTAATGQTNLTQCQTTTKATVNLLTFQEGFGTAFKTRFSTVPPQSLPGIPGSPINAESGLLVSVAGGTATAGLADWGTRLKATFTNVPTGVNLFVSVNNVTNAAIGLPNTNPSFAQLVTSEVAPDNFVLSFPFVTTTPLSLVSATDNAPSSAPLIGIAPVTLTGGSGTAVWEVTTTVPSAVEKLNFAVYASFTASVATNSPAQGVGTVTLSFAPTPGTGSGYAATDAAKAQGANFGIPRFSLGSLAAAPIINISICRTILLYPFVTNSAGFDTGLAIANTSTDAFGTGPQNGSCTLKWYSGGASQADSATGNVASGTVYTNLVSVLAPNFQGYMMALCPFQYAHGYAAITDLGAQKQLSSYLALVVPDPGTANTGRPANPAATAGAGSGESNSH